MATYVLGSTTEASGCLTKLDQIVSRRPEEIEDRLGFQRGRLKQGFFLLLLRTPLSPGDFEFFGLTYFSGGKFGSPSNDRAEEAKRVSVDKTLQQERTQKEYERLLYTNTASYSVMGEERLVKVAPAIEHDPDKGAADQYPPSTYAVFQVNLLKATRKEFFVAAKIFGTIWTLWNRTSFDIAEKADPRRSIFDDPRRKIRDLLSKA